MSVLAPPRSPYKGLAAFDDSDLDALLFFGRRRETEVIAANLQAARLTVLYGPTGVGKSSVLRAGVARRLRQEPNAAVKIVDRWAGNAVAAVGEAIERTPADAEVYVILDQFEEYFLYHRDDDALPPFLASALADPGLRVNVLIGIREDALAELDAFRRSIPNLLANRLQLDRIDRRAAHEAILGPVARYNELTEEVIEVEPAFVESILDEVTAGRVDLGRAGRGGTNGRQADRIEAPYLQLVLQTVWDAEREAGSDVLRAETLRRLGGAARIVHEHLEHAMAELTSEEKQAAAAMYNYLVTPSGTKIAHRIGDLAGYASLPEPQAARVLEKLARERIVRASAEDGPASARYEIFHDVLADAVLAWRARHEEQRALHEAELRRRRAFFVATAALVGLVLVAAIAVYALIERGNSRAQARRAHAEELAAKALTGMDVDPSSSLRLAYDAARLKPGGREEDVLRRALLADRLRSILRAEGPVTVAAFDSSGRQQLAAGLDGKVRVYRHGSIRPAQVLNHGSPVTAATFSPDGTVIISGGEDGRVRVWDPGSGTMVRRLAVGGPVRSVSFGDRGRLIVSASDGAIRVWRERDGKRIASIAALGKKPLVMAVVGPGARQIATVTRDSVARVYSTATGRLVHRFAHNGFVEDVAFSPDGRFIVTAGYDDQPRVQPGGRRASRRREPRIKPTKPPALGGVRVWDARSGRLVRSLIGAQRHVGDVTVSRDGKLVAAASADGTARVWEMATGIQIAIMIGHTNEVTSVAFNPAGTALVTTSSDGTARVWGATPGAGGRLIAVLAGHRAPVAGAEFSPNGRSVLTAGEDNTARVWDPGSEPELAILARSRSPLTDIRVTADGRRLLVEHEDGATEVRRLDGTLVRRGFADDDARRSRDGSVRAVATATAVRITFAGTSRAIRPRGTPIHEIALDPDGRLLAVAADDGTVQLWDARSGRLHRSLQAHTGAVNAVDFSADGGLLVSAGVDRDARIWSVRTGGMVQLLHGHFGPVLDARFSPDGRWIVTAGPITAGLWLVRGSEKPLFLDAPVARPLSGVVFAGPDGRTVVAASLDGTLRTHECDICGNVNDLLALARRRLAAAR